LHLVEKEVANAYFVSFEGLLKRSKGRIPRTLKRGFVDFWRNGGVKRVCDADFKPFRRIPEAISAALV
jgi:hypothetical protein